MIRYEIFSCLSEDVAKEMHYICTYHILKFRTLITLELIVQKCKTNKVEMMALPLQSICFDTFKLKAQNWILKTPETEMRNDLKS